MREDSLRIFRHSLGLSQLALADLIGCRVLVINRWENGYQRPARVFRNRILELMKEKGFDPETCVENE